MKNKSNEMSTYKRSILYRYRGLLFLWAVFIVAQIIKFIVGTDRIRSFVFEGEYDGAMMCLRGIKQIVSILMENQNWGFVVFATLILVTALRIAIKPLYAFDLDNDQICFGYTKPNRIENMNDYLVEDDGDCFYITKVKGLFKFKFAYKDFSKANNLKQTFLNLKEGKI